MEQRPTYQCRTALESLKTQRKAQQTVAPPLARHNACTPLEILAPDENASGLAVEMGLSLR